MDLRQVGANMTQLSINSVGTILFSYNTPVAAHTPEGTFKTSKNWSVTTSRHINKWLDGVTATERDQSFFEELIK
jgi:hypothetical protein